MHTQTLTHRETETNVKCWGRRKFPSFLLFFWLCYMKNNHNGGGGDVDGWRKKFNKFPSSFCFYFYRLVPLYCSVCSFLPLFSAMLFMISGCVVHISHLRHHTKKLCIYIRIDKFPRTHLNTTNFVDDF
jgi:hypothetical protein